MRLQEGEGGVDGGKYGGNGTEYVVPAEGPVEFEADEETDEPCDGGPCDGGRGGDDDVCGFRWEVEGWHGMEARVG